MMDGSLRRAEPQQQSRRPSSKSRLSDHDSLDVARAKSTAFDRFAFAGAVIAVTVYAASLVINLQNEQVASEISAQQRLIEDGIRLSRINNDVVRAIAQISSTTDDDDLRILLARHGISFRKPTVQGSTQEGTSPAPDHSERGMP